MDIDAAGCGVVDGDLYRGIPGDDVVTDEVTFDSGEQKDPIRIPDHNVVHDHVVVRSTLKTDAEVIAQSSIAIST